MSREARKPLPVLRLVVYLLILAGCGALACHELFYWVFANNTEATVVMVGKTAGRPRSVRYWADFEYFDAQGNQHTGRFDNVHPATYPGDPIEIQYLRHAPEKYRPT